MRGPLPRADRSIYVGCDWIKGVRSREQTGPLRKNNKFLTFDSNSTSDYESDVLKRKKNHALKQERHFDIYIPLTDRS